MRTAGGCSMPFSSRSGPRGSTTTGLGLPPRSSWKSATGDDHIDEVGDVLTLGRPARALQAEQAVLDSEHPHRAGLAVLVPVGEQVASARAARPQLRIFGALVLAGGVLRRPRLAAEGAAVPDRLVLLDGHVVSRRRRLARPR